MCYLCYSCCLARCNSRDIMLFFSGISMGENCDKALDDFEWKRLFVASIKFAELFSRFFVWCIKFFIEEFVDTVMKWQEGGIIIDWLSEKRNINHTVLSSIKLFFLWTSPILPVLIWVLITLHHIFLTTFHEQVQKVQSLRLYRSLTETYFDCWFLKRFFFLQFFPIQVVKKIHIVE